MNYILIPVIGAIVSILLNKNSIEENVEKKFSDEKLNDEKFIDNLVDRYYGQYVLKVLYISEKDKNILLKKMESKGINFNYVNNYEENFSRKLYRKLKKDQFFKKIPTYVFDNIESIQHLDIAGMFTSIGYSAHDESLLNPIVLCSDYNICKDIYYHRYGGKVILINNNYIDHYDQRNYLAKKYYLSNEKYHYLVKETDIDKVFNDLSEKDKKEVLEFEEYLKKNGKTFSVY